MKSLCNSIGLAGLSFVLFGAVVGSVCASDSASAASHSAYNPRRVYNALNVKAVQVNSNAVGSPVVWTKTVGGLTCAKSTPLNPTAVAEYTCAVEPTKEDAGAIYGALKVKEVNLNPGIVGSSRLQKSVGGLTCVKSTIVLRTIKESFDCQFEP